MTHQNWLASLVLIAWPWVAMALFTQLRLSQAILWTILGAQLVLPTGALFKFAMIPQFDKISIPNICLVIGCLIVGRRPLRIFRRMGLTELLIFGYVFSPIATSINNGEAIDAGGTILPGVGLYDAISSVELAFIAMLPFFIGRQFLRSFEQNEEILRVLVIAGVVYSFPMMFEVRMSPNLQNWIYGFSPSDFIMSIRGGGYRPMVFMGNGLIASFFMMTTAVAAAALWRARKTLQQLPMGAITAYLGAILILCKSFGAALYGIVLVPVIRWTSPRFQIRIAIFVVSVALTYPMLRSFDLFPTQSLVDAAALVSQERALSLKFRFDNEDTLVKRAFEKPLFGWGRYGRNLVYNEDNGRDESVTDGLWVITLGQFGLFGFLTQFGLLSIAVFRTVSALRFARSKNEQIFLSALALMVSVNILELIPNSGLLPWTWLMCGALLGRAEALLAHKTSRVAPAPNAGNRVTNPPTSLTGQIS
jgi:hypothetical protein